MGMGFRAAYMIAWAQTEVDGLRSVTRDQVVLGSSWRWTGTAVQVDVPDGPLVLGDGSAATDMRQRAANSVRQLVEVAMATGQPHSMRRRVAAGSDVDDVFVVTDGLQTYTMTVIEVPATGARLVMAMDKMPPVDQDMWVMKIVTDRLSRQPPMPVRQGVICFGPGTRLATPHGPRTIESLQPGDRVNTKDNGPQDILWTGHRRLSGARLHAMPHLRPVRFRAGALGIGQPDQDLVVSPQHRMLIKLAAARTLFGTDEVLVAAEHLLNGRSIAVDLHLREVTYVHILLASHNVIWANGLETESFHPAHMDLSTLAVEQHAGLMQVIPAIARSPDDYGDDARRSLTTAEAAILRQDVAA
jgi:Hint domain